MSSLKGFRELVGSVNDAPTAQQPEQIDLEELTKTEREYTGHAKQRPPVKSQGRGRGKSAMPEYERLTVYVRKDTKKAAVRKWEDTGKGGDMSDLVETLLSKYLIT